jgi:hypothetical protein
MNNFIVKTKANKSFLYIQVIAFVLFMACYHSVYDVIIHNLTFSNAFGRFLENRIILSFIQGFFIFCTINYMRFIDKKMDDRKENG